MRVFLVALTLVLVVLSGCADKPQDDPVASSTSSSSRSSSSTPAPTPASTSTSTSAAPAPNPNSPPVAKLSVNATSGTAPLALSFSLGGTDQDGDALTYEFSAGDAGQNVTGSLPATLNHTFASAGNYTASLTVSDGKARNTASVSIAVLAGQGIPPPVTFNGTAVGICQLFDPTTFETICLPEDSLIHHSFTVPPGVTQVVAFLSWDLAAAGPVDLDLYVMNGAGTEVGSSGCANVGSEAPNPEVPFFGRPFGCVRGNDEEATVTGIQVSAEETWVAEIVPYQAPSVPYTLTITYS